MDQLIEEDFIRKLPDVSHLKKRARIRMPGFAYDYLSGGANDEINLSKNTSDLRLIELKPTYIKDYGGAHMQTQLFGKTYAAPFGIAPVGLQGLMWPNSTQILAKAASRHNVPFVLSTVTTASIEETAELTDGNFWFQLYHPADEKVKINLLRRASDNGCNVLVALADTPSFGLRYKDIVNGLSMPPKMTIRNFIQIAGKPKWALSTLYHGQPQFESLKPYMPKNLNLSQLGKFMNDTFDGRLNEEKLKKLRDQWKGKLVVKGIVNEDDAELAVKVGIDGIIASNHGGRQIDVGESSVRSLIKLQNKFKDRLTIMMDSGIQSGPDIARSLAVGADFTFLGRTFMYGVGALGNKGGNHTIAMLKMQLAQIMDQLGCEETAFLKDHLLTENTTPLHGAHSSLQVNRS